MTKKTTTSVPPSAPGAEGGDADGTEAVPTIAEAPVAPIALSPQGQQARAEFALETTQQRIRELGEALAAIEPRRVDLAEREQADALVADRLAQALAVQPDLINAAQARLLVVAGTAAEEGAQIALAATREHAASIAHEEAEARAVLAATRATVAQELAQLKTDAEHAEAERTQLAALVKHLQAESAEARRAVGEELLAAARDRADVLRAEVEAAETRLAEAKNALEQHRSETETALGAYPDARELARQTGLLARGTTQVEQALEAKLALLRLLQRGGFEVEAMDRWPLWEILGEQNGFMAAIAGTNHAYWTSRIQATETWLASFRQLYRAGRG